MRLTRGKILNDDIYDEQKIKLYICFIYWIIYTVPIIALVELSQSQFGMKNMNEKIQLTYLVCNFVFGNFFLNSAHFPLLIGPQTWTINLSKDCEEVISKVVWLAAKKRINRSGSPSTNISILRVLKNKKCTDSNFFIEGS